MRVPISHALRVGPVVVLRRMHDDRLMISSHSAHPVLANDVMRIWHTLAPRLWVAMALCAGCAPSVAPEVDSGLRSTCDGGDLTGCPCDEPGRVVCSIPRDFICSGGTWDVAADVCGELDSGVRDVGGDANDACSDEGAFTCGSGGGVVCCGGHRRAFSDGPCGPFVPDAGSVDAGLDASVCGASPFAEGCRCDVDAGAAPCIQFTVGVCVDGTWHRSAHACNIC